jgi:hypothetical protein
MLRYLMIFAAAFVLGAGAASAQQQDIVVGKMEVPGAGFEIVVVKSEGGTASAPSAQVSSLVASPTGDWLAFATEAEVERIFGSSQSVIHAFQVEGKQSAPSSAVHVYVVAKGARTPSH